jgi:hypothetical protein
MVVGKGSKEHDLVGDFLITDSTWDNDTRSKEDKRAVQGRSVSSTDHFGIGVLSKVAIKLSTFVMKKSEKAVDKSSLLIEEGNTISFRPYTSMSTSRKSDFWLHEVCFCDNLSWLQK